MIHICIYSFYKDPFLLDCLKSVIGSCPGEYLVDLYIYSKEKQDLSDFQIAPSIKINFLQKPKSFSYVANLSLSKAFRNDAEYFLLLNSDTILHQNCISSLIKILAFRKDIGIIGGYQTEYYGDWNSPNEWIKNTIVKDKKEKIFINNQVGTFYETVYVQGACMMFRPGLIEKIGKFDERFDLFYEETEFCRRALNANLLIGVLEDAKVKHYSGGTWKKNRSLHLKRDVLYLSNQIIFESTGDASDYLALFKKAISISKKQLKNIRKNREDLTIGILEYPLVLLSLMKRFNLLFDLYKNQKYAKREK